MMDIHQIQASRRDAKPNPGFQQQLEKYETTLRKQRASFFSSTSRSRQATPKKPPVPHVDENTQHNLRLRSDFISEL
jgi:hypothetical protein